MIEKRRDLHGVYIRISEDGGNAVGAHVEWLERVMDTETGQVYAATPLPPEPLEPSRAALEPLMGEAFVAVQIELDRERAAHTQMWMEYQALGGQLAQLQEAHATLLEQNAALASQYAALKGQLEPEPSTG